MNMMHEYQTRLVPLTRLYLGTRQPFTDLTVEESQTLFDLAFPDYDHDIVEDDLFHQMVCPPMSLIAVLTWSR